MRVFFIALRKKRVKAILPALLVVLVMACFFIRPFNRPAAVATAPVYQGSAHENKIALTFNVVWGEEYVPHIIGSLKEQNVPATFFIGGQWAEDFPELVGEISRAGHEVGSHGYSHPHPDKISLAANIEEIKKTEEVLRRVTGKKPALFAPPYGEKGDTVLKAAVETGYVTILWSIDTIDWQRPDPSVILRRVTEKAHNGAIVLMHPTAPTVHALPPMLRVLKRQGYELVEVSELLDGLNKEKADCLQ